MFAAEALETDERSTNEAQSWVLGCLIAHSAGLPVVVLEDSVVVVGKLQQTRSGPVRVLNQKRLQKKPKHIRIKISSLVNLTYFHRLNDTRVNVADHSLL